MCGGRDGRVCGVSVEKRGRSRCGEVCRDERRGAGGVEKCREGVGKCVRVRGR